jgi:hypothetical protein
MSRRTWPGETRGVPYARPSFTLVTSRMARSWSVKKRTVCPGSVARKASSRAAEAPSVRPLAPAPFASATSTFRVP